MNSPKLVTALAQRARYWIMALASVAIVAFLVEPIAAFAQPLQDAAPETKQTAPETKETAPAPATKPTPAAKSGD
jgi:hypothetical protein